MLDGWLRWTPIKTSSAGYAANAASSPASSVTLSTWVTVGIADTVLVRAARDWLRASQTSTLVTPTRVGVPVSRFVTVAPVSLSAVTPIVGTGLLCQVSAPWFWPTVAWRKNCP